MLNSVGWDTYSLIDRFTTNPRKFLSQINQLPTVEQLLEEAKLQIQRDEKAKETKKEEEEAKQEKALLSSPPTSPSAAGTKKEYQVEYEVRRRVGANRYQHTANNFN